MKVHVCFSLRHHFPFILFFNRSPAWLWSLLAPLGESWASSPPLPSPPPPPWSSCCQSQWSCYCWSLPLLPRHFLDLAAPPLRPALAPWPTCEGKIDRKKVFNERIKKSSVRRSEQHCAGATGEEKKAMINSRRKYESNQSSVALI